MANPQAPKTHWFNVTHFHAMEPMPVGPAKQANLFRVEAETETGQLVLTVPISAARQLLGLLTSNVRADDYQRD